MSFSDVRRVPFKYVVHNKDGNIAFGVTQIYLSFLGVVFIYLVFQEILEDIKFR